MIIWPTLIALGALLWLGLMLHHIFEGEWLPHDLWREWKLSRLDLKDLDEKWRDATERSDIVITFTTTPSRINLLHHTLKSLLDQTRPPKRIVLNIPNYSIREDVAYVVPPELDALHAVDIRRTDDLGPGTKLLPALAQEDPDTPLLVLDDDRIYPAWLIERYETAMTTQPDVALTMGGWVVPENLTDGFTTLKSSFFLQPPAPIRAPRLRQPKEIDVMLGVFSYLVRPRFFDSPDPPDIQDLTQGPPELRYVDDVRTSALCNVAKFVIPARSLSFVPWRQRTQFQSTRLGLFNRGNGGGTRHNTIGIQYFAKRWRVGGANLSRDPKDNG